ncbi:hypothetical protein ACSLN1_25990 [Escherichia coli]
MNLIIILVWHSMKHRMCTEI